VKINKVKTGDKNLAKKNTSNGFFFQPKLIINQPNDAYEVEADAMADKVMRMEMPSNGLQLKPLPISSVQRKCAHCEEEKKMQRKEMNGSETTADTGLESYVSGLQSGGQALSAEARSFYEPRFGYDFSSVKVHTDSVAAKSAQSINALAYTSGNNIVFNSGQYSPNTDNGKRLLGHELTHVVQQGGVISNIAPCIQREMKFEFQTKNKIWRNDGVHSPVLLERKYGPKDYLVKGASGVRMESETRGVIEFETGWSRKWNKLEEEIKEAAVMIADINAAPTGSSGRKILPLNIDGLRQGSKAELKKGKWGTKKGYEGINEKILKPTEVLEVEILDSNWNAGIQSSEGFYLNQYESFLKEHEFPFYNAPVVASAQDVINTANTSSIPLADLVNLKNFLEIIINYILRGQGGAQSVRGGAFADVETMPSKQAFVLLSRTDFSSIYENLISAKEKALFKKIVNKKILLTQMGLNTKSRFFIKGYGTHYEGAGPTTHQWLTGIFSGYDLLSVQKTPSMSSAMGKYDIEKGKGKPDTGLLKFEARNSQQGVFKDAVDWKDHAETIFLRASICRPRHGTGTNLHYDGSKTFTGSCT
jgi:Domain of unknown function (DUF4157)